MSAASIVSAPVYQYGDGQEPKITSVTRLAIQKRLLAEGADVAQRTAAVNSGACRAIVEAAIRRDLVHAQVLPPERQALFMHPRRFGMPGVKKRGPGIAQAGRSEGWIRDPGTYYWIDWLIYIVDATGTVRTTLMLDDTQYEQLWAADATSASEHAFEPVLELIRAKLAQQRAELDQQPQESPRSLANYVPMSVRLTNRVTPHISTWLRTSRLGLLIVAGDARQDRHIGHAAERIADTEYFPLRPQVVLVDSAVAQTGREVLVELLGTSSEAASQADAGVPDLRVIQLPDSPSHDWDDALQKLPTDVQRWWSTFVGLNLPRNLTTFPIVLTPGLARTLLKILQPGKFREDNLRTYQSMFTPGAALDLCLGSVQRKLRERQRFL